MKVIIDKERCKGCGLCILYCPKGCLSFENLLNKKGVHPVKFNDGAGCTSCGYCYLMCPDYCIEIRNEKSIAQRKRSHM